MCPRSLLMRAATAEAPGSQGVTVVVGAAESLHRLSDGTDHTAVPERSRGTVIPMRETE